MIAKIPKNQTVTYARVLVDFRPQKADPHCIRITVGGNLINYPGKLSTRTADLTTSKLMWNSVLSTEGAKYMCFDIKNFYLTAPLDHFECMKMPLALFSKWIIKQYDLQKHVLNGFVYLEMRRAVWASHKWESSPINYFADVSSPMGLTSVLICPACGNTRHVQSCSH
jgi:hypothetical protein